MTPHDSKHVKNSDPKPAQLSVTGGITPLSETGTNRTHTPTLIRFALETVSRGITLLRRTFGSVGVTGRPSVRVDPLPETGPEPQRDRPRTDDELPDDHLPDENPAPSHEFATVYPGHFGTVFWDVRRGLRSDPTIQSDTVVCLEEWR